jgi:HlyD family secretion protein
MKSLVLPLSGLALWASLSLPLSSQHVTAAGVIQEPEATADAAAEPLSLNGTMVPSKADEVVLWPKAWTGGYRVLEVMPHGAMVERGQVIAVLDAEALEKQVHDAELAMEGAQLNFALDQERAELEERSAHQTLESMRTSLERAERNLVGWREFETQFNVAQAELSTMYGRHGIEDATDELDQLEAMYTADELTDATEEIVLKRSRRNLERSKISQELQQRRRDYEADFSWTVTGQMREEAVEKAARGLHAQEVRTELDAISRNHRLETAGHNLERQEQKLEKLSQDLESMQIRAPRSGMLLHGGIDDYKPGKVAPRHSRGGQLASRKAVFTVAAPGHFDVHFKAPEDQLAALAGVDTGTAVIVGLAEDRARVSGQIERERFPIPSSASGGSNQYACRLHIGIELEDVVPGQRASVELQTK